jgi:hypothetical protein
MRLPSASNKSDLTSHEYLKRVSLAWLTFSQERESNQQVVTHDLVVLLL